MTIDSLTEGIELEGISDEVRYFGHVPGGGVVFEQGALDRLGEFCKDLPGASHVLLVSDPGIAKVGHIDRAVRSVERAGLHATVFDDVRENPTTDDVERAVTCAKSAGIDVIVGLGGGSSSGGRGCV